MNRSDPKHSRQRETMLVVMLSLIVLSAVLLFSFIILGPLMVAIIAVVAMIAVFGLVHYLLWGHSYSERVADETADEDPTENYEGDNHLPGPPPRF